MEKTQNFECGDSVDVKSNKDDIFNDFMGTIVSFRKGIVQVRDQEDNVWDCVESQLTKMED